MAERRRNLGITARRPALPAVQPLNLGQSFFSLSKFFGGLKDKEDASLGTEQGAAAALAGSLTINGQQIPTFKRSTGTGPFGAAFNKSGLAVYGSRVEMALREKARELGVKHPLNPAAQHAEMTAFVTGLKSAAPIEFRAGIAAQGAKLIGPRIDAAVGRLVTLKSKDTAATLDALLQSTTTDAQELAAQVAAGGPGAEKALVLLSGSTRNYFTAVVNAIDGRTFTAGMARERIQLYQSEFFKRILMGMFDGADDKLAFIEQFSKGDFNDKIKMDIPVLTEKGVIETKKGVNIIGMMDAKALNFVRSYMSTRVKDITGAAKHRLEADKLALKNAREKVSDDFLERILTPPADKPPLFYRDVLSSILSVDQKKNFIKMINDDVKEVGKRIDAVYNDLYIRVASLEIPLDEMIEEVLPFVGHGLAPEDYSALRQVAKSLFGEVEGLSYKNFLVAAKSELTKSNIFKNDPQGDRDFFAFTEILTRRIRDQRKAGVSLREMLNPKSTEYLGPLLNQFKRSLRQQIRDQAGRLRAGTKGKPPVPKREPGETSEQIFQRLLKRMEE